MTTMDFDKAASESDCETEVVSTDGDLATEADIEWLDAALDWDELIIA
jgi:hypothetical protein